MIDIYSRYQKALNLQDLYPTIKGVCCCGCGQELTGRRTRFATEECRQIALINYYILKGNTKVIRRQLELRDGCICSNCGVKNEDWDADHIIPVHKGGGGCTLDNYQTLCKRCHKAKTKLDIVNG